MYKEMTEIFQKYMELEDILEENGGELTPELEKEFDNIMQKLSSTTDAFGDTIKWLESLRSIAKEKADKHRAESKRLDNTIKALKAQAIEMIKSGIELKSESYKIKVAVKKTPSVYYTDYSEVPEQYLEFEPKVKTQQWVKDIKNNRTPKPEGFFVKETEYLSIR